MPNNFFFGWCDIIHCIKEKKKKVSQGFHRYAGLSSEAGLSSTSCSEIKVDKNKEIDIAVNPTCNQTGLLFNHKEPFIFSSSSGLCSKEGLYGAVNHPSQIFKTML